MAFRRKTEKHPAQAKPDRVLTQAMHIFWMRQEDLTWQDGINGIVAFELCRAAHAVSELDDGTMAMKLRAFDRGIDLITSECDNLRQSIRRQV